MKKKNIILTGASSGIGWASAQLLSEAGHRILIAGRNEAKLHELGHSLKGEYQIHIGDVRNYADCQRMVEECTASFGHVDVLINNAGLGYFDPLEKGTIAQWTEMVDINITGVLNCFHACLPSLKEHTGHIINIGSVGSHLVFPDSGIYCVTKHAVLAISESIRIELNGQVKVTTISPGAVDTDFINKWTNTELKTQMKDYFASAMRPETVAQQIAHTLDTPDDVVINEIIVRPFR